MGHDNIINHISHYKHEKGMEFVANVRDASEPQESTSVKINLMDSYENLCQMTHIPTTHREWSMKKIH